MDFSLALLIPIMALSIPIIAILSNTYSKTHSGDSPSLKSKIFELEDRLVKLESHNLMLNDTVIQLEDKQSFLTRIIEDKSQ